MMKLRALEVKDIPYMLEWMKDRELVQFYRFDAEKSNSETAREFIERAKESKQDLHFAIVDEQDEYLGTASLKNIDYVNKNAEYAIALRKKAIGQKIALAVGKEIFRKAFEELQLERVYSNVLSSNERCIRHCEKLGYVYEGEFKNHLLLHEKFESLKWFAILKEQYYV